MSAAPAVRRLRRTDTAPELVEADLCVVGAGIAGVSAALEAARRGRRVVLVDAGWTLGGQSVGATIGTFCGLYSNGPDSHQIVHGIADDLLDALDAEGATHRMFRRNTIIVQYRVDALSRWIDEAVRTSGATVLLGAVLVGVDRHDRRITGLDLATRHGPVRVRATGYVDASGDAALAWLAGLPVQQPDAPVYGSMMLTLGGVDEQALAALPGHAITQRLREVAEDYGLVRHDGFAFAFPGAGETLVNMTHLETPLTPQGHAAMELEGRRQCDLLLAALRAEFPAVFDRANVRRYGHAGIRQSRWIVGTYTLTAADVRSARRFPDAVARCSWPIEVHADAAAATWEVFDDDHIHQVPLRSLLPAGVDNLAAAGRCLDADVLALASVRVMGTCIATGAAAAHALDLAGPGSVHEVDVTALQQRLRANLTDPVGAR